MIRPTNTQVTHATSLERGVALIVAMLLLVVISVVALSAVRFSSQAIRIAANNEMRLTAFQSAQSVVDAAANDSSNTPVTDTLGYVACSWLADGGVCAAANPAPSTISSTTIPIYGSELAIQGSEPRPRVVVRVQRLAPLDAPCPRRIGSSAAVFGCAKFSVEAAYDHNAAGDNRGSSEVHEGMLMVYLRS